MRRRQFPRCHPLPWVWSGFPWLLDPPYHHTCFHPTQDVHHRPEAAPWIHPVVTVLLSFVSATFSGLQGRERA